MFSIVGLIPPLCWIAVLKMKKKINLFIKMVHAWSYYFKIKSIRSFNKVSLALLIDDEAIIHIEFLKNMRSFFGMP